MPCKSRKAREAQARRWEAEAAESRFLDALAERVTRRLHRLQRRAERRARHDYDPLVSSSESSSSSDEDS